MFGQTAVTNTNYVVSDSFGTAGTAVSSFFFRIVINAIKQLRINISEIAVESYLYQQLVAAIYTACVDQDVDLTFLASYDLKQLIALLPKRLLELFVFKYRCSCGERDYIVSLSVQSIKCDACGCYMMLEQAPVLVFTKTTNQVAQTLYGQRYSLNGFYTSMGYSVLVDFQKLENGSKDVFLLETMEGSKIMTLNGGKIRYLTFLQPDRLRNYLVGTEKSVRSQIGNAVNVCWFSQAYMTQRYINALDPQARDVKLDIAAATVAETPKLQPPRQQPVYQPQQPTFVTYTSAIYVVLGLVFLVLFILMILLSVLIGRYNKTLNLKSIYAKGVTFASVPQVQRAGQIQPYLDNFTGSLQNGPQRQYVSRYSLYMGNTNISNSHFEKLTFSNASIEQMTTNLSPSSTSSIIAKRLDCERISATTAQVATARIEGYVVFQSKVDLNITSGSVGNATASAFSTGSINSSGDISCYYFTSNALAVGGTLQTAQASVTSSLQASEGQCPVVLAGVFSPANMTFQGAVLVEQLEVNASTVAVNSVLESQETIFWDYQDVQFNGVVAVYNLTCPEIEITGQLKGDSAVFSDLRLSGNFDVSGDLNLQKVTVTQSCNVTYFAATQLSAQTISASGSLAFGGYGGAQGGSASFNAASHRVGQFTFAGQNMQASTAVSVRSANISVAGTCTIGNISGETASGVIHTSALQSPSAAASICTLSTLQSQTMLSDSIAAAQVYAASLKLGTTEFAKVSGGLITIDAYMIKSQVTCDEDASLEYVIY